MTKQPFSPNRARHHRLLESGNPQSVAVSALTYGLALDASFRADYGLGGLSGYCLDAPSVMPSGAWTASSYRGPNRLGTPSYVVRPGDEYEPAK